MMSVSASPSFCDRIKSPRSKKGPGNPGPLSLGRFQVLNW